MVIQNKALEATKIVAITEEVEASFQYIITGLKELNQQKSAIHNNHVSLQLFSSGFERVLKILLTLKDKHLTGTFPELSNARKRFEKYNGGHGIEKMLDELIEYAGTVDLMRNIPMVAQDIEYLKNNSKFREFIKVITGFAIKQRYYYIDTIVLGNQNNSFNPFQSLKNLIYSFNEEVDITQLSYEQEEEYILSKTIVCVEMGIRAISRFFTHGFGDTGRRYYSGFSNFILLKDQDLGSLHYAEKKTSPSDNYKPMSSLSPDFLLITFSAPSKMLYACDFAEWPFMVESVKVYSARDNCFFVVINNEVFSLTGWTSTRQKMPTYFSSDKLKPRQYATFLLDEAQKLLE